MISYESLRDATCEAYRKCLVEVPKDIVDALRIAREAEINPDAIWAIDNMIAAALLAKEKNSPVCADIGIPSMDIRIGTEIRVPKDLPNAVRDGMMQMHSRMGIEPKTLLMPIDKTEGLAPIAHYESVVGKDYVEIVAVPKGGGTEPKSIAKVFDPATPAIIKKWVIDYIAEIAGKACPPYVVGLGIGGNMAIVAQLAMQATLRPVNAWHPNPAVAAWEHEMTEAINELGWGPVGVGGKTSCFCVHIETAVTSLRWCPVAFCLKCWPNRRGIVRVYSDGRIEPIE